MNTNTDRERNTINFLQETLEALRSQLVDLEAMANAARNALDVVPYLPSPREGARYGESSVVPDAIEDDYTLEQRLAYGRLGALVIATAESARTVLMASDTAVFRAYRAIVEPETIADARAERDGSGEDGGSEEGGRKEVRGPWGVRSPKEAQAPWTASDAEKKPSEPDDTDAAGGDADDSD